MNNSDMSHRVRHERMSSTSQKYFRIDVHLLLLSKNV